MPKPLSIDLRERIVSAVDAGESIRSVAAHYAVSPSAVSKISRLWRRTGSVAPKPMGGDRRSHRTEAHGVEILGLVSERPDITLDEIREALCALARPSSNPRLAMPSSVAWPQSGRALATSRSSDVARARANWQQAQTMLDPRRLVFIDETWAKTNMARTRGRAARGERLIAAVPHGHWKTTTLIARRRGNGFPGSNRCATSLSFIAVYEAYQL